MTSDDEQRNWDRFSGLFDKQQPLPEEEEPVRQQPASIMIDTLRTRGIAVGEDALVGTTISNKYKVLSFIGRGGMSGVYKVEDLETGNYYALKLLHEHLWQDPDAVKRFKLEGQAMSRLSHPNLISLIDFGISEEQQPFLILDLLEGKTLTDAIKRNNGLPLRMTLHVLEQLSSGLAEAHRQGVLHRDIKPDNIMFVSEGDGYHLKLVDFGVAKIIAEDVQSVHLTKTGEVFGSPLYMSPEQCMGEKISERTDIYLLGLVAYATVTGRPPISGKNVLDIMNKQISEMPPPLSQARPDILEEERRQGVDIEDMEYLIGRCLAKDPYERYHSMDHLCEDVRQVQDGLKLDRDELRGLSIPVRSKTGSRPIPEDTADDAPEEKWEPPKPAKKTKTNESRAVGPDLSSSYFSAISSQSGDNHEALQPAKVESKLSRNYDSTGGKNQIMIAMLVVVILAVLLVVAFLVLRSR